MKAHRAGALAVVLVVAAVAQAGVTRYYIGTGGPWNSTANWSTVDNGAGGASIPNGVDDKAYFSDSNNSRATTLDTDVVLGAITINDRKYWQIVKSPGANTITLRTTSGDAVVSVTGNSNQSGTSGDDLQINPDVILDLAGKALAVTQNDRSDNSRTQRIAVLGSIGGVGDLVIVNKDNDDSAGGQTRFKDINNTGTVTADTQGGAGRILFQGVIGSHVTSVTKKSTGIAELSGSSNAYTGGTFVQMGTLQVNNGSSLGAPAPLEVSAGAKLDLKGTLGTVQGTVTKLKLGGVVQTAPATYGSTGSGATFQNDTYFSGTGMVKLVVPATVILLK